MTHLLLRKSHRFPKADPPDIEGWHYDRQRSRWQSDASDETGSEKPKPKPMSKKADFETGEDMKGP